MSASGYRDIYSGVLHKCGGRIKSWTKRWMVLRSDYCLYYYKDATKNHLGVISLRDPQFRIRDGQKSDVSWPKNLAMENTFALVTTPRVYFMYAETRVEAEEWRKVLKDAHNDLVEVARTKSFSGRRSTTVTERSAALSSHSVEVHSELRTVARPKAHTTVTESVTSNASSVFGRQFTLSSSSDISSPLAPVDEVESMYNVLQHPLVQQAKMEGGEGERGRTRGEPADYSELPGHGERGGDDVRVSAEYDYVIPPDAVESCPQNVSVTINEADRLTNSGWAGPDEKRAGLMEERPLSRTSLEAFYDFAREAGGNDRTQDAKIDGVVYEEVKGDSEAPPTENTDAPHKMTLAVNQPLPDLPSSLTDTSSVGVTDQSLIYEDVPDRPHPPVAKPHPPADKQEVLYEPVVTQDQKDDIYSEVEYTEEGSEAVEGSEGVEGSRNYGNLSPGVIEGYVNLPRGGVTPPIPKRGDDIIVKPIPTPRRVKPCQSDQSPSNTLESDQLPNNRPESDQSRQEADPLPSNGVNSLPTQSPVDSPLPNNSLSSEQVPIPAKQRLSSSSESPPSIQPFQRKFSPPPSPRSQGSSSPRSPRPPSPLLSDRRVCMSPQSSVSSNHSNEGSPGTSHRQRAPSLKEKGIALFQRRQQEVASLAEVDTKRRKRSITMLQGIQRDTTLSPDDKVLFAETLREVESERLMASEERFRWERERMQLEMDRRQLQMERLRLQEELERTKNEILQS